MRVLGSVRLGVRWASGDGSRVEVGGWLYSTVWQGSMVI